MESNAQLINRREAALAALGRAEAFVADFDATRDQAQVPLRLDYVDKIWAALENVQGQLEDSATTAEGKAEHAEIRAEFEPRLFSIKASLLSKMPSNSDNTRNPNNMHATSTLSGIKLPTISLPEFDGDFQQWLAFHDTFVALIHSNPEVPDIQKFHYLKAAVKGEAAQLIESISISAANYRVAWETLTGRYSNEYLLKKRHLQALFDIQMMKRESAAALHGLVDEFERHVKILRQLGEATDTWSTILEHLLCTRLHDDTLKAWEDHASKVEDPNYACLIEFLQRRIRVLESISVNHHSGAPAGGIRKLPNLRLSSYSTTASGNRCVACDQPHFIAYCHNFQRLSIPERQQIVNSKRLCINCLRMGHQARNCKSEMNCRLCNRRHHSLLHTDHTDRTVTPAGVSSSVAATSSRLPESQDRMESDVDMSEQMTVTTTENFSTVETSLPLQRKRENVFLLTVVLKIVDAFGQEHPARALLDSASQPNIISERLANLLRLKRNRVNVTIQGAGKLSKPVRESVFTEIRSRHENFSCGVSFLIMDRVTADLPSFDISTSGWNIPQELVLADPAFNKSQQIDLILGAKHFYSFFPSASRIQLADNLPILVESVFGWIVAGASSKFSDESALLDSEAYSTVAVSMVSLEERMESFWKTEELSTADPYSSEERHCESVYQSTVRRNSNGRYEVRYPRQPDFNIMLGASKENALRRFQLLERRLDRNPKLREEYLQFMQEYLSLGHMRLVDETESEPPVSFYLPHHPIIKEASTTTKVRVVFDASAKTSTGHSLNESLCVGPVVQEELLDIILRFRTYQVALVGDIAKMYRQILVHPDDTPLQRILWRFSPQSPIQTYELLTVTYGLAPSSYLATRTLQQLADDEGHAYPLGGPALRKNFYVDDFIGGARNMEEAIRLRTELSELLTKGGFELRKWTSNRLEVLQGLGGDQIGTQSMIEFVPNETVKALGISWEPEADCLRFDSQTIQCRELSTKRSILSDISRLFDPLGLIAPVVVRAKIVMQELWLLSCEWDDPVPEAIQAKWRKFCTELTAISQYRVERCIILEDSTVQIHTFADASEAAYGACTYVRCEDRQGRIKVSLLAAKSRVAPLKRLTLPRLELCAAVLAAHLHEKVKKALDVKIENSYFWSDSAVVLQWLKSPPNTWKTFVANRVAEVQHHTHGCSWNHVAGSHNPADLVSRGMPVEEFVKCKLWQHGPDWLARSSREWPASKPPGALEDELEIRQTVATHIAERRVHPWFLRWSSYHRTIHVVAYCFRFIAHARSKARTQPTSVGPVSVSLTVGEIERTKTFLTRLAQEDAFVEEIKQLKNEAQVAKRSPIRLLSPFLDPEGVLRVGGRLNLSQLPYQTKHPALLPSMHPFTRLIAEYFHRKLLHGGGRVLINAIREEFWPLHGRRLALSTVRNCFRCTRLNPIPAQQQIGQLPASRITPSRPFSVVGVDYAGPIYIKPIHKRALPAKAYICLFVCFATKAVYIDLAVDLSTQAFLKALRRFISRHGYPAHIHSDNGKNFEGAKNEIQELLQMRDEDQITSYCSSEGITWHLAPPKAPHFGGLWESAIKVAKKHLYRTLGSTKLSFEEYATILAEIAAVMNSRPLLPLSEDPNDLAALTPAHFIIGSSMHALPGPNVRKVPISHLDHYMQLQAFVQEFWCQWRKEYLHELQRDIKGHQLNQEIQPGRMVIVVDELQPPTRWPLARIAQIHPGSDGITRVVSLRTTKGIIKRPIVKICLLPFAPAATDEQHDHGDDNPPHDGQTPIQEAEISEIS